MAYTAVTQMQPQFWYDGLFFGFFQSKNSTVALAAKLMIEEIERIKAAAARTPASASPRLFQSAYTAPVACAIVIAMFNQLSGINALLYYAPRIFELAGAGADTAMLQSVAVGGTNLVFTILALFLLYRRLRSRPIYQALKKLLPAGD